MGKLDIAFSAANSISTDVRKLYDAINILLNSEDRYCKVSLY